MTEFVVLSRVDMHCLHEDKPVTIWIDHKPYVLCTDEYFEKQMRDSQTESEETIHSCNNCLFKINNPNILLPCMDCDLSLNPPSKWC